MSKLLDCFLLCDCSSYLDSLLLLFGLFVCIAGYTYRKRHILSWIDLNQPILYVAAAASQHFMENVTLLKLCFNMSLYYFFSLTLFILNLPYSCYPFSVLLQMNGAVL